MKIIFVFGSNLAGRHGKGAAYYAAKYHGAIYGKGEGLMGTSYAIPTKDKNLKVLSLEEIRKNIRKFIKFAHKNSDMIFLLTPIGTGYAGYGKLEIARLFHDIAKTEKKTKEYKSNKKALSIPTNVVFTKEWFDL